MPATSPNVPPKEAPNHGLAGKVRQALADSADVSVQNLSVHASDNMVRLVGIVDTLREKQRAGQIAVKVVGRAHVENDLTVTADRPLMDPEIRAMIEDALGNYPESDPRSVGVREVEDGVVYLSGKVPTIDDARGAADIVSGIKGVAKVVNEIEVAAGLPIDDIDLGNFVVDAISDDPRIDPFDIHVQARNGEVYINGEVADEEARMAASELARGVPGVRKVLNLLRIREGS